MRKAVFIGLGAVTALAAAALAVAAVYTASGVTSTSASLVAKTPKGDFKTRTCTGADNSTFTITDGRYTGMYTSNPAGPLDGPLTVRMRTVVDTKTGLGTVEGSFHVKDGESRINGKLWGTLDGTSLSGFLVGSSRGAHATVVGTLTGMVSPGAAAGNGLDAALGSGSVTARAVVVGPVCKGKPKQPPKPERPKSVEAHGTISTLTATDIVVTTKGPVIVPCKIPAGSTLTSNFAVGNKVEMRCTYDTPSTSWLLSSLKLAK